MREQMQRFQSCEKIPHPGGILRRNSPPAITIEGTVTASVFLEPSVESPKKTELQVVVSVPRSPQTARDVPPVPDARVEELLAVRETMGLRTGMMHNYDTFLNSALAATESRMDARGAQSSPVPSGRVLNPETPIRSRSEEVSTPVGGSRQIGTETPPFISPELGRNLLIAQILANADDLQSVRTAIEDVSVELQRVTISGQLWSVLSLSYPDSSTGLCNLFNRRCVAT